MSDRSRRSDGRLAGWACLASAGLLLAGLGAGSEDVSELFLIAAPALLAPAMILLSSRASVRATGLLGVLALAVIMLLLGLAELGVAIPGGVFPPLVGLTGAMSVWIVLVAVRGPARIGMPLGVAVLGVLTGISWLALLVGSLRDVDVTLAGQPLWSFLAPLWVLSYLAHTVWLGCWLIVGRPNPIPLRES